eukprot:10922117-Alexandrium_andersonii.AAC.1
MEIPIPVPASGLRMRHVARTQQAIHAHRDGYDEQSRPAQAQSSRAVGGGPTPLSRSRALGVVALLIL